MGGLTVDDWLTTSSAPGFRLLRRRKPSDGIPNFSYPTALPSMVAVDDVRSMR